MEQSLLEKKVKSDNWLFNDVTPLIKMVNSMDCQIQNKDITQFVIQESNCKEILNELRNILDSKPKNLYKKVFNHFYRNRILQILGIQTLNDLVMMSNLLTLNYATKSLTNFNKDNMNYTILSICGIMALSTTKTYLNAKTDQFVNLFVLRLRVIIQYLIYDKALRVQCISSKDSDNHSANINTLLTADLDEIMVLNLSIRDTWEAVLLLTGCLIFLYSIESHAGTIVVVTMICAQIFNVIVTTIMMRSEKKMLQYKDKRVGLSTDIIEGMKQIKYLSWEYTFSEKIMKFRSMEFFMLFLLKAFDGLCSIFWNNVSYVLLCAYIISSINSGKSLLDLNIFTLIAVFNTMTFPLGILPWCLKNSLMSYVSLQRIYKFLNSEEIDPDDRFQLPYIQKGEVIKIDDLFCEWPIEKEEQNKRAVQKTQVSDDVIIFDQPTENSSFRLKIDNLSIQQNTLNFIIGKIGSGKSALFNAILNELQKYNQYEGMYNSQSLSGSQIGGQRMLTISDQIIVKGNIGYCSQSSWVQNMSIRDNILFGQPFIEKLYNQIIDVCELHKDILTFEKHDLHEIGPDGKNLSGGQKQRITLARALYQESDIYLLDDIFSSLDVHIADQIFQKAIIEYLINRGKTVLMITSHYRYLNQYPNGNIIFLENGEIIRDQQIINEYLNKECEKEDEEEPETIENELDQLVPELQKQQSSKKQEKKYFQDQEQDEDDNQEKREQGKINFKTWTTYFSSMSWILLISWVIVNFCMQGSLSLIDFWLKSELNQNDSWLHNITLYFDNDFCTALFYLTLFALAVTFVRAVLYVSCALRSAWVLFVKLNKVLMTSIMKFYDQTNAGRIINRIQDDTYMIDDDLSWTFHCWLENISRVTGLSIGLAILQPIFLVILFLVGILYYQVSITYVKSNREIKRLKSVNQGCLLQTVNETLTGIKIVRAFNKTNYFDQQFKKNLINLVITDQCGERSKLWFGVRLNLMSNLILISITLFVIFTIIFQWSNDFTVQALSITYSMVVIESFYDLFSLYLRLESGIVSVEREKQYFENETENIDKQISFTKYEHDSFNNVKPFIETNQNNSILFRNIFLTYENISQECKFALKNFSLEIIKGEKVAFVGRTGSGKTSILNILFGLYKHQYGELIINGQNTRNLTLKQLRSQLSVVPQFGFLYNATVKENLDPLDISTKIDIEKLFNETGFQLRGINNSETNTCNADYMISQNGSNLSNGEKQVINFLRIVLMDKQIICLDEATSNMDPKTDQLLHDLLFKFTQNKTLLVITHRLENIQLYDKIVVMEQGEIVEQGKYNDLIKIEGGFFNKLISHHQNSIVNK